MLDFTFVGIYIQMLCCEDQFNRDLFLGADSLDTVELVMAFDWPGDRYDPFSEGDEIAIALVRRVMKTEAFDYTDGRNRLTIGL